MLLENGTGKKFFAGYENNNKLKQLIFIKKIKIEIHSGNTKSRQLNLDHLMIKKLMTILKLQILI